MSGEGDRCDECGRACGCEPTTEPEFVLEPGSLAESFHTLMQNAFAQQAQHNKGCTCVLCFLAVGDILGGGGVMEWQPIETAPKAAIMLLWFPGQGVAQGQWSYNLRKWYALLSLHSRPR